MDSENTSMCESLSSLRTDTSCAANIVLPALTPDGALNLSGQNLTRLPNNCDETYAQVTRLDISCNKFRTLDSLNKFVNCKEVNASQNELVQLRHFVPMKDTLEKLSLFDNKIASVDFLHKLVNLRHLDFSHNRIEYFPVSDDALTHLVALNLSHNRLKSLPSLHNLPNLVNLNLSGNLIRSISDAAQKLPFQLDCLEIGGNLISDLCEIHYLSGLVNLHSLTVLGNIFVRDESRQFSYRSFVHSCILNNLQIVDGTPLTEEEIVKGEWIQINQNARFRPGTGAHNALCEFLSAECPTTPPKLGTTAKDPFTSKLSKVLEKRREHERSITESPNRVLSPLAQSPLALKSTNFLPHMSPSPTNVLHRVQAKSSQRNRYDTRNNTASGDQTESPTPRGSTSSPSSRLSSSTVILSQSEAPLPNQVQITSPRSSPSPRDLPRTPISSRTPVKKVLSPNRVEKQNMERTGKNYTNQEISQTKHATPKMVHALKTPKVPHTGDESRLDEELERSTRAVTTIQRWWRKSLKRLPVMEQQRSSSDVIKRIGELQSQLDELASQNTLLTTINEAQTKTINDMAVKIKELENGMRKCELFSQLLETLIPAPVRLNYNRNSDTSVLVGWDNIIPLLSMVDGYEIFVNDVSSGKVLARNKQVIIRDIEIGQEYKISIQAISRFGELRSLKSDLVILASNQEDEKENIFEESPNSEKSSKRSF
ncbi:leucine rich repeats (2 copies) domain-containing protein [Ditylenchus destructor]|uniref:Leucine rich repeats (2 copies) domain-containing protein n=1 Tax=Ditylenchus destructor TaxID=166010 RepID=A0AAD4N003_9BILA|nr:leucine rich repeats (2 copies) domain-containing protein [Ditylenchus destructor]